MDLSADSPRRGRARASAGALVAASVLAAVLPAAPATAAPLPATVASADDADDTVPPFELELENGGVAAGPDLDLTVTVENPTDDEFADSAVEIALGASLDDAGIQRWLDDPASIATTPVASIELDTLAPGESEIATHTLDVEDMPPGVYPVFASHDSGDAALRANGVVIVPGEEEPSVALVVPITGPVAIRGLYAAPGLATLTGPEGLLTAQLDAVDGTDAVLAVDPAIPAAIRSLGDAAPADAVAWLDRLMALDNDRFALQFADADVSPQIDAGLDAPLRPTHLGTFLDPSVDESETPATLRSLSRIGERQGPTAFWPSPGSADDAIVEALAGGSSAHVLVPASSTLDRAPALGDDALAYGDALSDALLDAAREPDAALRERALSAATARIHLAAVEADGPLLLALDRMGSSSLTTDADGETVVDAELTLSAEGLAGAVAAAVASPAATAVGFDDVLSAASGSVPLADVAPDAARQAAVTTYLEDEPGLEHVSKALETPAQFLGEVRAQWHQLMSVTWTSNQAGWDERAGELALLNDDRQQAIDLQQQQPVQLLSAEAPMPVWIRNDLPYAARVTVVASPDDPRLSIERRTEVVAQGDSVTRLTIPIEARVGSGKVTVHYSLQGRAGTQIGPERTVDVTVRADWERIGIGIFVALVIGLFALGTVRQLRRRRREREAAADVQESGA